MSGPAAGDHRERFERLRDLILRAEIEPVAELLAPLEEKDRQRLSGPVWKLQRALERGDEVEPPSDSPIWARVRKELLGAPMEVLSAAQLAVLGVCPMSRVRGLRFWFLEPKGRRTLIRILRDRRPEWLGDWVEHVLQLEDGPPIDWSTIRDLVREGLCPRPESPAYVQLMARRMVSGGWGQTFDRPLDERLLDDPALLEVEVWSLFEVETGPEVWYPKLLVKGRQGPIPGSGWAEALRRLAERGELDRQRLLDHSLESLASGLSPRTLSSHRRFHESLEPTLDEITARQKAYRVLLGSRHGAVAGFGLKMLGRLHRAGRLETVPFLAAVTPVFELPAKAHALRALALVARCLDGDGESRVSDLALKAAAAALLHPSREVRERALEATARVPLKAADGEIREDFEQALGFVEPALARRLAERLGIDAPGTAEAGADAVVEERELRRRFDALSRTQRQRAGLEAWPGASLPPPWRTGFRRLRVLRGAERVAPIRDFDQLVDAVSHAVEIVDSATEVERLLGGLARLGAHRPAGFARRTEALASRLDKSSGGFTASGLGGSWGGVPLAIVDLLRTWLTGRRVRTRSWVRVSTGPYRFLRQRVNEVAVRLARGHAGPLLAEPTHRHGWIDPRALVERVAERPGLGATREPADLVQALLRLAPDHRREAREAAGRRLSGFDRDLIDFALGGERRPRIAPRTAAVWLAAARCRSPDGSLRPLLDGATRRPLAKAALRFVASGPDALEPARYSWRATTTSRRVFWGEAGAWPYVEVRVEGRPEKTTSPYTPWEPLRKRAARALERQAVKVLFTMRELPTSALHRMADDAWEDYDQQTAWQVEWARQVWPANTDAILASGVRWISRGIDYTGAASSPHHAYLGSLLDSGRPWTEIAYLAAGTGLLARDPDVRGVAVDALVEGIGDGRVHPEPLGEILAGLWQGGWAKANRLASGLEEVARVGPLHELVVAGTLDRLVAGWPSIPHGAHHVFQLLDDALAALEAPVSGDAARVLESVRGGGKTARLARSLAQRRAGGPSPRNALACRLALDARIRRVEGLPANAR